MTGTPKGVQNPAYRLSVSLFLLHLYEMNKAKIKGIRSFLKVEIWRLNDDEVSKPRGILYKAVKIIIISVKEFNQGRLVIKSSALTYNTLFSIIPLLAILFAIVRGLGFSNLLEMQIKNGIGAQSPAMMTIMNFIDSYLSHTKSGVFIGVGLIMLLWTILTLINNIERTFNSIWQVKKPRTIYRKMTDYFSMLLLIPIFLVLSGGISIFISTMVSKMDGFNILAPILKFSINLIPFFIIWLMFIALYSYIPNTRVKLKHCIIPGILAGTAAQFFQYLYIGSQIWVSRYNAIYGSFAAIPMFLLWTQITWSICLFGAELSYVSQNLKNFYFNNEIKNISRRYHDFLCILIMSLICKRFQTEKPPYTAEDLSDRYKIPIKLTNKIIYELVDINVLKETPVNNDSDLMAYIPAIDINILSVGMLINKIDTKGSEDFKIKMKESDKAWDTLNGFRKEYYKDTDKILLKDIY